jgi:hypothetical protein
MDADTLPAPPAQQRGFRMSIPFLIEAWRTITWRHVAWTVGLGVFAEVLFITVSHAFTMFLKKDWNGRFEHFYSTLWSEMAVAFFFLLCIVGADHAVRRGAPRFRSFLIASIVAALLGAAFDSSIRYVIGWFDQPYVHWWWKPVHPISHFMWYLVIGGFIAFVYADLQRSRETAARLQAAVLRRTQAARDVLQTRLRAMQARVEPQFLFDTLARVREIYERDPAKGQRTLDDLITYLRTAMPQMRDSASTLAREIDLVRTYVAILAECSDNRIQLAIDADGDWSAAPFPPMLLLPLVEHAIAGSRLTRPEDGAIALRAVRADGRVQVTVGHGGGAFSGDDQSDAIARVREHLQALFDADARLDLRKRADHGTEIVLEIPG